MSAALVLRTAGTNCDGETVEALRRAGARTELVHVRRVVEDPRRLDAARLLVIPGGFSYGDDIAAGRVLGYELRSLLAEAMRGFVARGGLVLGVCNGFQVLVDTGLLESAPGEPPPAERSIALAANASARFECRWVVLRGERCACPWIEPGELTPMPVAHGEGRFVTRDAATLARLADRGQIALRYVRPDAAQAASDRAPAPYPHNPNGSLEDIAGICDPSGRVLGLMPHPERNVQPWHHPWWTRLGARTEGEGLSFYRRMVEAAAG